MVNRWAWDVFLVPGPAAAGANSPQQALAGVKGCSRDAAPWGATWFELAIFKQGPLATSVLRAGLR